MRKRNKGLWNKVWLFCIIWIMMNLFSNPCYAKTAFSKAKPLGVMSTAVKTDIVISWEPLSQADGYEVYESVEDIQGGNYRLVRDTSKNKLILHDRTAGSSYSYYVRAYRMRGNGKKIYSKAGDVVSATVPLQGVSTIKTLLKTAVAPVGFTMYVWGGGWNKADTAAGKEAKSIGVSAKWRTFAKNKRASYNYKNYRYQIHNGLDCSGYVGWCIYNVMNTKNGQKGYVYSASKQAKKFSGMGFGSYRPAAEITGYKAGDIMSSTCSCCGHVWIVVGQCDDGSVVLIHSSPAGVQLSGTVTPTGRKNSEAYRLAKKYMKKYYQAWYKKYPDVNRGSSYLTHYGQMRWNTTGKNIVLSDPDGYQDKNAKEILTDLFEESSK